jgi:TonB family protein
VNDPVDRVIVERARMDAGFPGGLLVSLVVHFVLAGVAVAGQLLFPAKPIIRVADAFAVPLPRGGGNPAPANPATGPEPKTEAPAPAVEPPKVLKPPKDEPRPSAKAVPELDPRKTHKKTEKPEPARAPAGGSEAKSTGAASATPGLALGPGPGVPDGTDSGGDWYLAGVQQKIWMIWSQQIKSGFTQPVAVTFTILADGSVAEVHVTQSSGASLLDLAAQRAIYSAAPFAPLPRSYDTTRKTIQAVFRPTS